MSLHLYIIYYIYIYLTYIDLMSHLFVGALNYGAGRICLAAACGQLAGGDEIMVAGLVEGKIFTGNWLVFPQETSGFSCKCSLNPVKWVMKNQTNCD